MSSTFVSETSPVEKEKSTPRFKNRNRIEIVANILDIARNGALKTHLMYKANLSYMVVTQYLGFLIRSGLIEEVFSEEGPTKMYKTTAKGFQYMEVYDSLQSIAGLDSQKSLRNSSSTIFA
jgi:predicted transcriptional regulator